ncbi:MAG: acyl-CoA thioesterase [Desulfomicrobium escambiense]|nr:acyl-CoA thioesterase [Desulfomicrobium escambiense]
MLYTLPVRASERDIDASSHVNNIVYRAVDAGRRHRPFRPGRLHGGDHGGKETRRPGWRARTTAEYLRPAYAGDRIRLETWVVDAAKKSSSSRRYRMVRDSDGAVLARGDAVGVCRRAERAAAQHPGGGDGQPQGGSHEGP